MAALPEDLLQDGLGRYLFAAFSFLLLLDLVFVFLRGLFVNYIPRLNKVVVPVSFSGCIFNFCSVLQLIGHWWLLQIVFEDALATPSGGIEHLFILRRFLWRDQKFFNSVKICLFM